MNELVSIVLPVYNGERFLSESIDSIIAQTYQNWELIIIDDCSSDSSPEIAKNYVAQDSRIYYYRNEQNMKLPKSLNRGFSLSKGSFLSWTSDDNRYLPEAISKMVMALQTNTAEFVFSSCNIIDEQGDIIDTYVVSDNSKNSLVGSNPVGACFMYTRNAYLKTGDYDAELFLVEDFDYWQRLSSKHKTVTISEILYDYRFHDGALTSTMKKDVFYRNMEIVLKKNRALFGKLNLDGKYSYYSGLNKCYSFLSNHNPVKLQYYLYKGIFIINRVLKRLV